VGAVSAGEPAGFGASSGLASVSRCAILRFAATNAGRQLSCGERKSIFTSRITCPLGERHEEVAIGGIGEAVTWLFIMKPERQHFVPPRLRKTRQFKGGPEHARVFKVSIAHLPLFAKERTKIFLLFFRRGFYGLALNAKREAEPLYRFLSGRTSGI
jgi:hypothetical protein